jgi:dolichol-phosphate mannosyltransferase
LGKRIKLAVSTLVGNSLFPLKLTGYLGIFITLFSGVLGIVALVNQFILGRPLELFFSGTFLLGLLNLFLIGIVLISLGLIALYIANIHVEVTNRPLYVVRRDSKKESEKGEV